MLSICLAILSLSAKAADISMRLEHDIETNPGPSSYCQGVRTRTNYIINLGRRGSLADLSKSCGLVPRVTVQELEHLVAIMEFSIKTPAWILLKDSLLARLLRLVALNAT